MGLVGVATAAGTHLWLPRTLPWDWQGCDLPLVLHSGADAGWPGPAKGTCWCRHRGACRPALSRWVWSIALSCLCLWLETCVLEHSSSKIPCVCCFCPSQHCCVVGSIKLQSITLGDLRAWPCKRPLQMLRRSTARTVSSSLDCSPELSCGHLGLFTSRLPALLLSHVTCAQDLDLDCCRLRAVPAAALILEGACVRCSTHMHASLRLRPEHTCRAGAPQLQNQPPQGGGAAAALALVFRSAALHFNLLCCTRSAPTLLSCSVAEPQSARQPGGAGAMNGPLEQPCS